jgi:TRAP-type C4-dicarboxylate transport system permease small subunit
LNGGPSSGDSRPPGVGRPRGGPAVTSGLAARLEQAGRVAEDAVLVLILTAMIVLAFGQIVLRNFLNIGFIWSDEALRMLVLWIAVAGAVAASRSDKHINIAVLDRFLPGRLKLAKNILVHAFTAAISGIVAWQGWLFVRMSHEFGDVLMGGVPAWILQAVLPVGFGLICYRYALFAVTGIARLWRGGDTA